VHDALVTCAPVVSQYAALAALELGDETIGQFRREFLERRNLTLGALDRLSHIFDYQKPNSSYFVFPRVKDTVPMARDSRRLARDILERAHVALVPGVAFGPSGEAHLRISYSRRREEIEEAFARLGEYFHGVSRARSAAPVADAERLPLSPIRERPNEPPPWKRSALFPRLRRTAITALSWLARRYLARVRPRCVAIAGLSGKTVAKRWLRELAQTRFLARANPRSYNTSSVYRLQSSTRRSTPRRSAGRSPRSAARRSAGSSPPSRSTCSCSRWGSAAQATRNACSRPSCPTCSC